MQACNAMQRDAMQCHARRQERGLFWVGVSASSARACVAVSTAASHRSVLLRPGGFRVFPRARRGACR
eukprot:8284908-Lingulodinium_polyedra.AAC.1